MPNRILTTIADHSTYIRGLGVFFSSTIQEVSLYFQSHTDEATTFHIATSTDGRSFTIDTTACTIEISPHHYEDITNITHVTITEYGGQFLMLYTIRSSSVLKKAWSSDLKHWSLEGPMLNITVPGVIVADYSLKKNTVFLGGDTDISLFTSRDQITWETYEDPILTPRPTYFDHAGITISNAFMTEKGILVLYQTPHSQIGIALLSLTTPTEVLWRCTEPIWEPSSEWQKNGAYLLGTILVDNTLFGYWHVPEEGIYEVAYALYKIGNGVGTKNVSLNLDRSEMNPLISPNHKNPWESFNTFNPAAIYDEGKVHILYRAQGRDYISVVGYASSSDGVTIDERLTEPVFVPLDHPAKKIKHSKPKFDPYASGGGYGGCEDPRITRIDDRYYMTYVAYDGVSEPRVALTSIAADDFLHKRWLWEKPVLISQPGIIDKSAVIFPEKIHGKYVVMHRVFPDILIDFVDSLDFDGTTFLKGEHKISVRPDMWDSRKIGAGAPPIKTKDGWLLIYYATSDQEGASRYLMGAMLLDLDDPTKVLYRSHSPILEPEAHYEWEGFKGGIVYPCGAVVMNETLYVYYGGADSFVCVATAPLDTFLEELKHSEIAKLSSPVARPLFNASLVTRVTQGPILSPNPDNPWEGRGTLNASIIIEKQKISLFYRADSNDQEYEGHRMSLSTVGMAETTDGIHFDKRHQLITPSEDWDRFGCEDPRITKIDGKYYVFYTALGGYPFNADNIKVGLAIFTDFDTKPEKHLITPFNAKAMTLFSEKINDKYVALLTVDTDKTPQPNQVCIAFFDSIEQIWSEEYWKSWYQEYQTLGKHILPIRRMNSDQVEVGAPPIKTDKGWLCIYSHMQHYDRPDKRIVGTEAVMLDLEQPDHIIARTNHPLLLPESPYELVGIASHVVFPSGAYIHSGIVYLYYGAADSYTALATMPLQFLYEKLITQDIVPLKVTKYAHNPLLSPVPEHAWESKAVFNPGAIEINGTIYLIYRAMSADNTSVLGLAETQDGIIITKRTEIPIYVPRADFEIKKVPNNNSGCEDPRLTIIDDTLYMYYTAYDGINPPRVALTHIKVSDFLAREYNWSDPILLSPPGIDDKDGTMFPEKINGSYAVLHRIQNAIILDYAESLSQFDGNHWLRNDAFITPRSDSWDSEKIGECTPPIKTKEGWLLFYHGVSKLSHQYRVGAMLLDLDDPCNVLARSPWPILEPDQQYEHEGIVNNIVFPCGAVIKENTIYLYYGAADTRVCVATLSLPEILGYLCAIKTPTYLG